jgi:hypothetical protein
MIHQLRIYEIFEHNKAAFLTAALSVALEATAQGETSLAREQLGHALGHARSSGLL